MAEKQFVVTKEIPEYWRITFKNPPLNMFDPYTFAELNVLIDEMEKDEDLKIVVFESADDFFFMDHHDMSQRTDVPDVPGARKFFYNWPIFVERLANCRVISVVKTRGRAWAQGFEFMLACDMRFASKEKAKFALIEAGGTSVPGGGGISWLSALCGRSRALEIVCSADEYSADQGELYGFVNRSIPDDQLDEFVDQFARRIAGFNKRSLMLCKQLVNARAGLPKQADLFTSNYILHGIDFWPEAAEDGKRLAKLGEKYGPDFELNFPTLIAEKPE